MRQTITLFACASLLLVLTACQDRPQADVPQSRSKIVTGHGGVMVPVDGNKPGNKINETVGVLHGMKLVEYPTKTIGEAFNDYTHFASKDWKETRTPSMKVFIDYYGMQKNSVLDLGAANNKIYSKGINVKFVINPDGAFYVAMISKVEIQSDGKMYLVPMQDNNKILDAIYANRKINF